jgi:Zinc finger, C2H2 type
MNEEVALLRMECTFPDCHRYFYDHSSLAKHNSTHHNQFKCWKCDQSFTNKSNRKRHEQNIHNDLGQESPLEKKETKEDAIQIKKKRKTYPCHLCPQSFSNLYNCQRHEKTHSPAMDPTRDIKKCPYCPGIFRNTWTLHRHFSRFHDDLKGNDSEHECDRCHHIFPTLKRLQIHINRKKPCFGGFGRLVESNSSSSSSSSPSFAKVGYLEFKRVRSYYD